MVRAKTALQPPDSVQLRLEGDVLEATGAAPRQWINEARRLARVIRGVLQARLEQIVDLTSRELLAPKATVEQSSLYFVKATTQFAPGQEEELGNLSLALRQLFRVAQQAGYEIRLQIIGHTDRIRRTKSAPQSEAGRARARASHLGRHFRGAHEGDGGRLKGSAAGRDDGTRSYDESAGDLTCGTT
jgi:flagellar motor protein MotB